MNRRLPFVIVGVLALMVVFAAGRPLGAAPVRSSDREQPDMPGDLGPSAAPPYGPWQIVTIDSQNDVGRYLSMAANYTTRTPDIAYYDATAGDLKLARLMPGNCGPDQDWNCTIIDGTSSPDVGQHVSLAFGPNGYGVAYYDAANGVNRFTSPSAGLYGEVIEHVNGESVGTFNALVYDGAGMPRVAYNRDIPGGVGFGYAKRLGSGGDCSPAWDCEVLQNHASFISIGYWPYSGHGIAYAGLGGFLGFARPANPGSGNCGGGAWNCEAVQTVNPYGTSLQMARCGLISCSTQTQIAFYDYGAQQIKLAEWVGNNQGNCTNKNWRCTTIDSVGQTANYGALGLSLLIDGTQPVIVYQDLNDQANSIVKIAYPDSNGDCGPANTWRCEVLDDGARGGGFISVGSALDAEIIDGRLYVAYYDASHGDMLLAYTGGPAASQFAVYVPLAIR
jgi:hypothetical protein